MGDNLFINRVFSNDGANIKDEKKYISKSQRTTQLIESPEFKDAFNLRHGGSKKNKKKRGKRK